MSDSSAKTESVSARELVERLALEAIAMKAEDVVALEVSELLYVTDFFVIATTHSSRQMRSCADALNQVAKDVLGQKASLEGSSSSNWLLMDLGDVIVHLLTPDAREFYGLDELWADAPRREFGEPDSDESAESA